MIFLPFWSNLALFRLTLHTVVKCPAAAAAQCSHRHKQLFNDRVAKSDKIKFIYGNPGNNITFCSVTIDFNGHLTDLTLVLLMLCDIMVAFCCPFLFVCLFVTFLWIQPILKSTLTIHQQDIGAFKSGRHLR